MTEVAKKSEQTRRRILHAALRLFQKQGFDETTMRDVAKEAGVALGAAYYYFDSKNAIVMAFYEQVQDELAPLVEKELSSKRGLNDRLQAVMEVKFRYLAPHRRLLAALSTHIDPQHPLSAFGERTRSIREKDVASIRKALEGAKVRMTDDLKPYLPSVVWLYQMGLILFWVYDGSPQQNKTRQLFERSLAIVVGLIKLSGVPLLRPLRRMATGLLEIVYDNQELAVEGTS